MDSSSSGRSPNAEGPSPASIIVKVGSSTVTNENGGVDRAVVDRLSAEIAALRAEGHRVVVVSSGAIVCGLAALGRHDHGFAEPSILQALSAVGQPRLAQAWQEAFASHGLLAGQVLLAPLDFGNRQQYLHARGTLHHLLELGVVPVVNENDAVADEEIRFGDNDRLAALVAHLVGARLLLLLTDAPGLLTADPRLGVEASLIDEVVEIDERLTGIAGGPGVGGSGGMASKLAAARMASLTGVTTVIADGRLDGVVTAAVSGDTSVGTVVRPRAVRMPARKLWIAFARGASGVLVVDDGARRAVADQGRSLLPAGVVEVRGDFEPDDAVEVAGPTGAVFAKGLVRLPSARARAWVGRRSDELPDDLARVAVHRDDLVVLV